MKAAFQRVKVPLIGVLGIILIAFLTFAVVRPHALNVDRPLGWSITGNAILDDKFFDTKITMANKCSNLVDPMCGSDGIPYQNLCKAQKAGADMRHRGPC